MKDLELAQSRTTCLTTHASLSYLSSTSSLCQLNMAESTTSTFVATASADNVIVSGAAVAVAVAPATSSRATLANGAKESANMSQERMSLATNRSSISLNRFNVDGVGNMSSTGCGRPGRLAVGAGSNWALLNRL